MPAITISPAWKAWRTTSTPRQVRILRRLAAAAAEAAHDYRMGETGWDYTAGRNALVVRALRLGVPTAIVAEASGLSAVKVYDIRREMLRAPVAA